jgi:hypothetical protein
MVFGWRCGSVLWGHGASCRWWAGGLLGSAVLSCGGGSGGGGKY